MVGTMAGFGWLGKMARGALALVVPPTCLACKGVMGAEEAVGFCPECYARLPWWDKTRVIPPMNPPQVARFAAPLLYEGVAREVLHDFKFHGHRYMARPLAKLLVPLVEDREALLVPVPMHPSRLRQRGYNQVAFLVREIGRLTGNPVRVDGLKRLTRSDGQALKTRAQRLRLAGSDFVAHPAVAGRRVILVDDILTTGATARACALALKRGGALSVEVVTVAYTPG